MSVMVAEALEEEPGRSVQSYEAEVEPVDYRQMSARPAGGAEEAKWGMLEEYCEYLEGYAE